MATNRKTSHRHSKSAVYRYLPIIERYLETYPSPVYFKFPDLRVSTATARLRDAIRAEIEHNYFPHRINKTRLEELWEESVVYETDDNRTAIAPRNVEETPVDFNEDIKATNNFANIDDSAILCIAELLTKEIISGPIDIGVKDINTVNTLLSSRGFDDIYIETKNNHLHIM